MAKPKTTAIKVHGEIWHVPRGFGAEYLRCVREQHPSTLKPGAYLARVRDLLLLIGYEATPEQIAEWPLRKRIEAEIYASNVHLRAGDNIMQAYPPPEWLPQPWKGEPPDLNHVREDLRAAFEGPGPTPIVDRPCTFCFAHDTAKDVPVGPKCGKPSVQEIHWKDGRVSEACRAHGRMALDANALTLVERFVPIPGAMKEATLG